MADGGGCEGFGGARLALGFQYRGLVLFHGCGWRSFQRPTARPTERNLTRSDRRAGPANSGTHVQPEAGKKRLSHEVI
jgi:hypothetical protein